MRSRRDAGERIVRSARIRRSGRSPLPWAVRRACAYLAELDGDAEMARTALEEGVRIARVVAARRPRGS